MVKALYIWCLPSTFHYISNICHCLVYEYGLTLHYAMSAQADPHSKHGCDIENQEL